MSALLSRIVVLSLVLLVAQNSASHAALSDADRAAIDKVERYINAIHLTGELLPDKIAKISGNQS